MKRSSFLPKVIFLDFFKDFKEILMEIVNSIIILPFFRSIEDLTIVFSDLMSNNEIIDFIADNNFPEKETDDLKFFFKNAFQTSFSYGYKNKEFIFIRLDKSSQFLNRDNDKCLKGLIIHEIIHSVQRQRGLEVRLRSSLDFSLEFFSELASIIPEGTFEQKEIINFLKQISQFALLTLKDIYANVEMIKRGYSELLLEFYKKAIFFENPNLISSPKFDVPFQKGEIKIKDLNEFAKAFNYTISLIPVWLPTMVLENDSIFYIPSRNLKHFIFEKYYINPSLITREMWHIENIFLTSFSFSKSFHVKWFGSIFNLALEYLLGEDFVFYHLSKAAELVEDIYKNQKDSERQVLAMVPILKAAYVHKLEYPIGIQQKNVDDLEALMKENFIDKDELLELEETFNEVHSSNNQHSDHIFENLLKLSIMIISRDLRREIFTGHQESIKEFGRTILSLLQAINYLGDCIDVKYYHTVRLTVKRIIRSYNIFKQKKLAIFLENITKEAIFTSDIEPTHQEIEELLYNYEFFEIPFSNSITDLGISFIHNIKTVMKKIAIDDPEFPLLAAQFILILLRDKRLELTELDQTDIILVSSLIAISKISFSLIQSILEHFLISYVPPQKDEEE